MSEATESATAVAQHYDRSDVVKRIAAALEESGLGEKRLSTKDLAQLDQFHSRGLAATIELAAALTITASTRVIDIGSGLGGPSRYLAQTYGCAVDGVDLSASFVEAATFLAERSGLENQLTYQTGNALALPFAASTFDLAWTQHVAMNLADRDAFYSEANRVLRPGGHFAIFDVVSTTTDPLHFPVPWAPTPDASFLVSADAMRSFLTAHGFRIKSWTDCTEAGIDWFLEREAERARATTPSPLTLGIVMGSEFGRSTLNLRRNLSEGRAALVQAICEKD